GLCEERRGSGTATQGQAGNNSRTPQTGGISDVDSRPGCVFHCRCAAVCAAARKPPSASSATEAVAGAKGASATESRRRRACCDRKDRKDERRRRRAAWQSYGRASGGQRTV